jgi:hypothetical protein
VLTARSPKRPFWKAIRLQMADRAGLTMVELLAATMLAALLMGAVLGVLKSVTRNQKVLLRSGSGDGWQSRLIAQLEWDLANSRTFVSTPTGFELRGFAGRDLANGRPLHGPTSVQYTVVTIGAQPSLVRSEAHLDSLNLDNQTIDLVGNRIERIALDSAEAASKKASENAKTGPNGSEDTPLPDQTVVVLYGVGQTTPVFQHAFVLR